MSELTGRRRTSRGDVVITRAVEGTVDGVRAVDIHVGEPAVWSTPAFRVLQPPQAVAAPGGGTVDDPAQALAEGLAAAGGVMIVRGRR